MDAQTKTKLVAVIKDSHGDAVAAAGVAALADIDTAVGALDAATSTETEILDARNMLKNLRIGSLDSISNDWSSLETEVAALP